MAEIRALAHPVRRFIIVTFFPALLLSLIHAIAANHPLPVSGLPVHLISTVVCAALLLGQKNKGYIRLGPVTVALQSPSSPLFVLIFDVLAAICFLVIMILTWANKSWDRGLLVLQTYASLPFLISLFIHAYLLLLTLYDIFGVRFVSVFTTESCPHCKHHGSVSVSDLIPSVEHSQCQRHGYGIVDGEEQGYRDEPDIEDGQTTGLLASNAAQRKAPQN